MEKKKINGEALLRIFYFTLYFVVALTIALNQPLHDTQPYYQNPPDEHARYMVPLYICNHGTIPTGYEAELYSEDVGVGWTYGFYTLLPYILQGYVMRIVKLCVTDDPLILLYTARLVNVVLGAIMAYVVLLIGRKLFPDRRLGWGFSFLVTFFPEAIFLHTYCNPDSMALLSTALMIYGLLRGYEDGFARNSCLIMSAGIILCALSYYNAYGYIVSCILLFAAYFVERRDGKWTVAWRGLLTKGAAVSALVLTCISWQFIRNFILYDGDFLGIETMQAMIKSYGVSRVTLANSGEPFYKLFTETDFLRDLKKNFIARYGSASIDGQRSLYRFYELVIGSGILSAVVFRRKEPLEAFGKDAGHRVFFHINMILCIAMPCILILRYVYAVDYQPQGRYIMPILVPLMFYVMYGLEKIPLWRKMPSRVQTLIVGAAICAIVWLLLVMVYRIALPLYQQTSVLG